MVAKAWMAARNVSLSQNWEGSKAIFLAGGNFQKSMNIVRTGTCALPSCCQCSIAVWGHHPCTMLLFLMIGEFLPLWQGVNVERKGYWAWAAPARNCLDELRIWCTLCQCQCHSIQIRWSHNFRKCVNRIESQHSCTKLIYSKTSCCFLLTLRDLSLTLGN